MSLKFEIADWRFEIDLIGMTCTPLEKTLDAGKPALILPAPGRTKRKVDTQKVARRNRKANAIRGLDSVDFLNDQLRREK